MAPTRTDAGVTLLELLVALAICAVLAAVAYPSYRRHVLRAHRIEAIDSLLAIAAEQERHHLAHGRYAGHLRTRDGTGLPVAPVTPRGLYALSVDASAPAGYVAMASVVAGGPQAADRLCARFTLSATGQRSAADAAGRDTTLDCWR